MFLCFLKKDIRLSRNKNTVKFKLKLILIEHAACSAIGNNLQTKLLI